MRTEVYKLFGVDVTQIPGLEFLALLLFSEVGRDLSRWKTAACFVSWLAPATVSYGGLVAGPQRHPAGRPLAPHEAKTAHRLAGIFYTMVKNQVEYDETIWEKRNEERQERHTASLKRQAQPVRLQAHPD